jgi:hypothetical protein
MRSIMARIAASVLGLSMIALLGVVASTRAGELRDARTPVGAERVANSIDLSAQRRWRRPPLRIEVRPRPRLLYRDCHAWLAREWRPSGSVIVPRQRCWWVRG